ncbi:50S ribosomal protein L11 methyltransferase [Campylobacter sp. VBCF_05 NA6]|uniref:50S ribosomal protein L11 methyltransferase n=1 Tax=unclassified Campylobacter TaxID=2593542 RepID=UPI0022E9F11C|nr:MULTISPECIES: 50S ribosomal protein L11 methyltransferase [unclassified Campylobacter]MDA3057114.1 50S ribosomal protein L11 methyltransferase [Campylobacter sp. VBCF_04 NA7]MDA3059488.1 50S ribosomal protein L11 methyltransferase [Campylobacter sp. VBCF_05 NA6]
MKEFYNEMSVKSQNGLEFFKDFVFELGISCIEEREGEFIVRDEDSLEMVKFALIEFKEALQKSTGAQISLEIEISQKKNQDWINEYKKGVEPIEVGKFYVRPSWCESRAGLIDILIDPALAFGSGHHESTNMCLQILSEITKEGTKALDVGCGSGILSIAMKKLGANVSACDTDEQATDASVQNAQKNGVSLDKIWTGSIAGAGEKYDLVVANIIADVILILASDLKNALNSGAHLVLSGILENYKDRIKSVFSDLRFVKMEQKNEWCSFVYEKGENE